MKLMHLGEFIKERRLALGYKPDGVARQIGISVSSYYDLEQVETDLLSVVSLAEIARLEQLFRFDIRMVLTGWTGGAATDTLQRLAERAKTHIHNTGQTVEEFENAVGWEVRTMLENPSSALEWNLDCLHDVCKALGVAWESINFEGSLHLSR